MDISPELQRDITVAIVAALLGFASSFILYRLAERRQPNKRISFDRDIRPALGGVSEVVKDRIAISYDGRVIEELYHVKFNLQNTGNQVIKNQFVRLQLSEQAAILRDYFEPPPPRELGAQRVDDPSLRPSEIRYVVKHLEKGQELSIHLILSASTSPSVNPYPFNDEGNVTFEPRAVSGVIDDSFHVRRAILILLSLAVFPPLFDSLPLGLYSAILATGARAALLAALLPHLVPFAQTLSGLLLHIAKLQPMSAGIMFNNSNAHIEGNAAGRDLMTTHAPPREDGDRG